MLAFKLAPWVWVAVTSADVTTATVAVLLVYGGLRPGGLAPDRSLTRFTWSVSPR